MRRLGPVLLAASLALPIGGSLGCASPYDRGETLYRQGDLRGAVEVWRGVEPGHRDYERSHVRVETIETELARQLRRYEKRAAFFEKEGRLAEAILYYRLVTELDPSRAALLDHVQQLARIAEQRCAEQRTAMRQALDARELALASHIAGELERLDPFDPAIRIEIRTVQAALAAEVQRHLDEGTHAYAAGERDPGNDEVLGYLSYLQRFEEMEQRKELPPPPRTIPREEILSEGHFHSAERALARSDPFLAITEYEAALRVNPRHTGARAGLAGLRERMQPQVEPLYREGRTYFQDEDLHNALRVWRRALLIDPEHANLRENVARAEKILSRLEEIQTSGP
jgi:tetratricopeptide (TPR) repeat protein